MYTQNSTKAMKNHDLYLKICAQGLGFDANFV